MGFRNDAAAALSTVDGVTGCAYRPTTPRQGDAWPLLTSLDRADGFTFTRTWRVVVALATDEKASSDWIDANWEAVVEALESVGFVDTVSPVTIPTGGSEITALQIELRSE